MRITVEEAAKDFAALLDKVRLGEEVTIIDSGRAVAVLRASDEPERSRPFSTAGAIERIREFRRQHQPGLSVDEIKSLINEGRK